MDTRFGHPDDWGLSPQRHSEIASELSDHLDCLRADEGSEAANAAEAKLSEPKVRRKLSAAHIADQVVATLHRHPSSIELRELGWLLFWFVLVICCTIASGNFNEAATRHIGSTPSSAWPPDFSTADTVASFLLWILSGVCRAGFLALLVLSMLRAWRVGPGVFIARLLQYKLLHTVLVLFGMFLVSSVNFYSREPSWQLALPGWLNHLSIGMAVLLAGFFLAWRRPGERLQIAVFTCMLVAFLVPSAPWLGYSELEQRPIAVREVLDDGVRVLLPNDDPRAVQDELARRPEAFQNAESVDVAANRFAFWRGSDRTFGPRWSNWKYQQYFRPQVIPSQARVRFEGWETLEYRSELFTPFTHPGSGLAWLAVPLPLMGVMGFIGMALVMGRRSFLSSLLYSIVCIVAIFTTVIPFSYAQPDGQWLISSSEALVHTPLPGFETLMIGYSMQEDWMLVFGLLFSAGIPWLLTGLFLKSGNDSHQTANDRPDMETT
ncbi:hypothetical protein KDL29_11615 [bacterium]|nr:hypothetical protein [bacterium]